MSSVQKREAARLELRIREPLGCRYEQSGRPFLLDPAGAAPALALNGPVNDAAL